MNAIHITTEILAGLNAIAAAGHGVAIDAKQTGGNSHTNTYITIKCRRPGEAGFTKSLTVKHTSSYSGQFSEWEGLGDEFGELCYTKLSSVDALVKRATEIA